MTRRSRDGQGPQLTVIYWRDIPAQVTARSKRGRATAKLAERFQVAIDAAATRAGKTGTDDYLAEWREERSPCSEDIEAEVQARRRELHERFTPGVLRAHVGNDGWSPGQEVSGSP